MALTPTQLGTKSRTIIGANPNIRSRPNGLGRTPRMGRVQQINPYQLGELVETPMGLRRIKGIMPFTMNVDLGPRGELSSTASKGATTISVKKFNTSVDFAIGDVLIIGGPNDSYRETVKVGTAVTITSSSVTVSLSTALKNSHSKGELVVSQKLPPDYDGEFVEVEELRILGDNKYAYVIPSVPKQPRYISRTGSFGDDTAKNEETPTDLDTTDNFRRYEALNDATLRRHAQETIATDAEIGTNFYQLYLLGFNEDGSLRPAFFPTTSEGGESVLLNPTESDTKNPMLLTATLLEKNSAEAIHVWTQTTGGTYVAQNFFYKLDVPPNIQGLNAAEKAVIFQAEVRERLVFADGRIFGSGLIRELPQGYVLKAFFSKPPPAEAFPTLAKYNAWNSISVPAFKNAATATHPGYDADVDFGNAPTIERVFFILDPSGNPSVYLQTDVNVSKTNADQAREMAQSIELTGTVSASSGSTTLTGSGTSFTSELSNTSGDRKSIIYIEGLSGRHIISNIASDTSLTLATAAYTNISGKKAFKTSFEELPMLRITFRILDPLEMLNQRVIFRGTSTTGKDNAGSISQRVFLNLPQGQARWSSKRALNSGKGENTGFIDAFQSPEDSPNETFAFYVGKNEESLPFLKASNKTGETILDGRVKLSGFMIDAPRVEAQELKKIRQRAGYYKAKLLPHTGYFPNLDDRADGPPDGWEPQSRRNTRNLLESLRALSADVKKEIRGG
jgi:hypothetical protein